MARETDEQVIRRQYGIPAAAKGLVAQVLPAEAGWFGREGLRITLVFRLRDGDFEPGIRRARAAGAVGNSTDQQLLAQFRQSMPPLHLSVATRSEPQAPTSCTRPRPCQTRSTRT